jgi:sugar phosphate isomerase/epimerase
LKPIIGSTHLHDNHSEKDDHLWPGEGNIDWAPAMGELKAAPRTPAAVLEIHYSQAGNGGNETADHVVSQAIATWKKLGL